MKLHLKALRCGSHRVAPANYTIPASTLRTFARWRQLNGRHLIPARYSFIVLVYYCIIIIIIIIIITINKFVRHTKSAVTLNLQSIGGQHWYAM